jgi:hypothetical protein
MKLAHYNTIHEGIADIDRWIEENHDAPPKLYRLSKSRRKTDLYALDHCQQIGQIDDREVTKSMEICSRIHKDSQELIRNGRLPRLDELGKNLVVEEMVNVVQDNTNRRKQIAEATTFVSTNLIDQHLLQPVKLHTMVQDFMKKLEKDMSTLDDSISMNNATLEKITYKRIKSLYDNWKFGQPTSEEKFHRKRT